MINRLHILELWRKCEIRLEKKNMFEHQAQRALLYKVNFYDPVSLETKIPWYVIAALDMREEDFNHNGYLGNGDPLWRKTRHVPRGRGPFKTWYEGAIDALHLDGMTILPEGGHWDIVTSLIKCEGFNGLGYAHMGLPSPYVWAGTNIQVKGKYVADGHFDRSAWDNQPGCAGLFLALKENHGIDLNEA